MSERCKCHEVMVFDKKTGNLIEKKRYYTLAGFHGYLDALEKTEEYKTGQWDWSSSTWEI
jgi:hypothetical protein